MSDIVRDVIADTLWKIARLGADVDESLPQFEGEADLIVDALSAAGYRVVRQARVAHIGFDGSPFDAKYARLDAENMWCDTPEAQS